MPQPSLKVVERERSRKPIKPWRSDAERERLPKVNQLTANKSSRHLFVNEILKRTEKELPEIPRQRYYPRYLTLIIWATLLAGVVLFVAWIR